MKVAAQTYGPFYIRPSHPKTPLVYAQDYKFTLGKAATLREGKDVTIIAIGIMVAPALESAQSLAGDGIDCHVLSMPTVKPLDKEAILKAATETGAIVTAEEHLRRGGLGSAMAQIVSEHQPVPMSFIAINDVYTKSGKAEDLLQKHRLIAVDMESAARSLILKKRA